MIPSQVAFFEPIFAERPASVRQVQGGNICSAFEVVLPDKRRFFVKTAQRLIPEFFESEADGLRALRESRAGFEIPAVIFVNPEYLVLEWLDLDAPASSSEALGRALARLHRTTAPTFGWHRSNFIGSIPQQNQPHSSWTSFYRTQRLEPLFKRASKQGFFSPADQQRLEKLLFRLENWIPDEKPALLHGDLWAGNVASLRDGKPVVFDPSVYFGHREMDLAMTLLFGGFDRRFYDAYQESFTLQDGWHDRAPLFQLYPLLVHTLLFGKMYATQVKAILQRYG